MARVHGSARGFALVLAFVGAFVTAPPDAESSQVRLIVGMNTTNAKLSWGWHPGGTRDSLDIINNGGATAGTAVSWMSIRMAGSVKVRVTTVAYTGTCTGVRMDVQNDVTDVQLGDYWYVHISPAVSVGTTWKDGQGWTVQQVGTVLSQENASCVNAGLWSGPHLHQGGESYTTPLSGNSKWNELDDGIGQVINPTFDEDDNWLHQYQYGPP